MIEKLDHSGIEFPISKKDYNKIEKKNRIRVNGGGAAPSLCRFAPCSSHREQITLLFALSSSFVLACARNDGFHSSARAAKSPWVASDPAGIGDSHPL